MNDIQTNERGEWVDAAGKLYHTFRLAGAPGEENLAHHEGPWLNCDGCNPVFVLRAQPDTDGAALRAEYAAAKEQEKAVKERVATATSKLKAYLESATNGALRSSLHVDGYKPVNLTYSEPWSVPAADLKAKYPAVYVELAVRGERWTLSESRGN